MQIEVIFNNTPVFVPECVALDKLLVLQGYVESGFAVAINQEFVARSNYETVIIQAGDKIDVIIPMQGG